jgi:hypothetical protein
VENNAAYFARGVRAVMKSFIAQPMNVPTR